MARHAALLEIGLVVLVGACAPSGRDPMTQHVVAPVDPAAAASAAVVLVSSTVTAAPSPSPTPTSPAAPPQARTPSPPATPLLRSAIALEPAGATTTTAPRVKLTPGSETVVDPAATFELELSARSSDARLVLVDAREDLVPATATREVGASTRLTLAPAAPLVPGSRYVLRLDGASDRDLHDEAGRAWSAVSLPLLAAGSPPPPEPKKQKPARKRRHR